VVDIEEPCGTAAEPVFLHRPQGIPEGHVKPRKGDKLGSRGLMPRVQQGRLSHTISNLSLIQKYGFEQGMVNAGFLLYSQELTRMFKENSEDPWMNGESGPASVFGVFRVVYSGILLMWNR
jgi:hypothetical protein